MESSPQEDRKGIQFACICGRCGEKIGFPSRSVQTRGGCGPGDSMELTCGHVIHALECSPDGREAEQVRANVECPICPKLLKDLAHEIARSAKRTLTKETGLVDTFGESDVVMKESGEGTGEGEEEAVVAGGEGEAVANDPENDVEVQLEWEREDVERELGNETPLPAQTTHRPKAYRTMQQLVFDSGIEKRKKETKVFRGRSLPKPMKVKRIGKK